ncbi:MAG TPA: DMT family transporter [Candidatus Limnocylindria bacterium]|nr:DMT family transporter [Candidatus Limnocylindria bacterium]
MADSHRRGILLAILAAGFYALNTPLSKLLLGSVSPAMLAALLYLGAGTGMSVLHVVQERAGTSREKRLTRKELPYAVGMVLLDIAAPVALMFGIRMTTAANAALLNNFEIVATSLIAMVFFGERISPRLWLGIALVTGSAMLLTVQDAGSLTFSAGSALVLLACVCWGLENNCTRMMSSKNPVQIVVIKGLFSGAGALALALLIGEPLPRLVPALASLTLGFVSYGLSIALYIFAQRELGAAKTSAYYAVAPFVGAALSFLIFLETPSTRFIAALLVMLPGTWLVTTGGRAKNKPESPGAERAAR